MPRYAAVSKKVSPARFIAYVNPGTNAAIPQEVAARGMDDEDEKNGEPQDYEALDADSSAD